MPRPASPPSRTLSRALAAARAGGAESLQALMALRLMHHAAQHGQARAEHLAADGFRASEILKHAGAARVLAAPLVPAADRAPPGTRRITPRRERRGDAAVCLRDAQLLIDAAQARLQAVLDARAGAPR